MPMKNKAPDSWIIILCLIFVFIAVVNFIYIKSVKDKPTYKQEYYIVQKYDTLWGLAENYAAEDTDLRDWIDEVKKINLMEQSGITEGNTIIILTEE